MVVLDEDFGTNLTLVEGNGGVRLSPVSAPEHAPRDWRSQCERERARADAAEARAEVVLSRFSSGYLIASLAIKETDHGTTIR